MGVDGVWVIHERDVVKVNLPRLQQEQREALPRRRAARKGHDGRDANVNVRAV
jgi:hypothetical protein